MCTLRGQIFPHCSGRDMDISRERGTCSFLRFLKRRQPENFMCRCRNSRRRRLPLSSWKAGLFLRVSFPAFSGSAFSSIAGGSRCSWLMLQRLRTGQNRMVMGRNRRQRTVS